MRRARLLPLAVLAAASVFQAPARATDEVGLDGATVRRARAWTMDATVEYVSKYVQTGESADVAKLTGAYAAPALREELSATDGRWTLSLWTSRHAGNALGMRGKLTDLDYTVERSFAFGPVEGSAGFSHLSYPNSGFQPAREGYLSFAFDGPLSPSVEAYWYSYPGDGVQPSYFLNLTRTFGAFELTGTLGFYPARTNDYFYGVRAAGLDEASLTLSLPMPIDASTTLTTSLSGSITTRRAIRDVLDGEDNVWVGAAVRRTF